MKILVTDGAGFIGPMRVRQVQSIAMHLAGETDFDRSVNGAPTHRNGSSS